MKGGDVTRRMRATERASNRPSVSSQVSPGTEPKRRVDLQLHKGSRAKEPLRAGQLGARS